MAIASAATYKQQVKDRLLASQRNALQSNKVSSSSLFVLALIAMPAEVVKSCN